MRSRRPSPEHEAAVARRLAALVAELEATRPGVPEVAAPSAVLEPDPVAEVWDEADECETTVVRAPGRHAARRGDPAVGLEGRGDGAWSRLVERVSTLALTPAHLAVVAALVAGGLAVTCWWLVASEPRVQPVAAPVPVAEDDPGGRPSGAGASNEATASSPTTGAADDVAVEIVVDVAGRVRRPGIVVLPAGSRVVDALEAAGGARRGVDLKALNLARPLIDGEQVLVGVDVPPGVASSAVPPGVSSTGPGDGLVNINLADQTALETLPGVGPVTATAIIAWRTDNGGFRSVDELLEVSGIGEATLAKLAPLVTL